MDNSSLKYNIDSHPMVIGIDLTSKLAHLKTGLANALHAYLYGIAEVLRISRLILFVTKKNLHSFVQYKYLSSRISIIVTTEELVQNYIGFLDAIHLPFNENKEFFSCPKIISIADLIPEHLPDRFSEKSIESLRVATKSADFIFTLSEYSSSDIIKRHNVTSDKIFFFPIPFFKEKYLHNDIINIKEKYQITSERLLLYPAAGRPHKNHEVLFKALEKLPENIGLILTTGETHNPQLLNQLKEKTPSLKKRIFVLGRIPFADYKSLFKTVDALVFPSIVEGFGIPIIEAFALECPVILSASSCLPEIAKESGLYFDPYDEKQLAENILKLLDSVTLREKLKLLGKERFKYYTDEKVRYGLLFAYQKAIKYFDKKGLNHKKNTDISKLSSSSGRNIHGLVSSTHQLRKYGYYNLANTIINTLEKSYDNSAFISSLKYLNKKRSENHYNKKKFVLLVDVSRLLTDNLCSGISRYVITILEFLSNEIELLIPFFNPDARGVQSKYKEKRIVSFQCLSRYFDLLRVDDAIWFSKKHGLPVIYHSLYHPLPANRDPDISYVLTIFDVFHITYKDVYNNNYKYITYDIVNSIQASTDEILCISRFTGADLIKLLNCHISMTYSPLAPFDSIKNYELGSKKSLLIPFQNDPRKGFDKMFDVIQELIKQGYNYEIIIFGKIAQIPINIKNTIDALNFKGANIILIDSPTDEALIKLYQKSFIFLYLSKLEGFGIPPMEAMQNFCPPIILNNSSLGEIYDGWEYMLNNEATTHDILKMIDLIRSTPQEEINKKCQNVLTKYNWDVTVGTHIASYLRALESKEHNLSSSTA